MEIPQALKNDIWDYCRLNNISNIDEFTLKLLKQGFTVEKFGATPEAKETIVEKIVEKIVEVPVEKIVEKIVEVPKVMVDTEVSENLKTTLIENEKLKTEQKDLTDKIEKLTKALEEEKNKKKKDIYGEN